MNSSTSGPSFVSRYRRSLKGSNVTTGAATALLTQQPFVHRDRLVQLGQIPVPLLQPARNVKGRHVEEPFPVFLLGAEVREDFDPVQFAEHQTSSVSCAN